MDAQKYVENRRAHYPPPPNYTVETEPKISTLVIPTLEKYRELVPSTAYSHNLTVKKKKSACIPCLLHPSHTTTQSQDQCWGDLYKSWSSSLCSIWTVPLLHPSCEL